MTLEEATSIWGEMTDVQREAVATLAPKIAPPWCGIAATRRGIEAFRRGSRLLAIVLRADEGDWFWIAEGDYGRVPTLDEAKAATDERLIAAGFLLSDRSIT